MTWGLRRRGALVGAGHRPGTSTGATWSSHARTLLLSSAVVSVLAAIGLAIAATGSVSDVLHVFGMWALLAGLAQIVVAVRRRAQLGIQWPMLIAGTLSVLMGVFYNLAAAGDDPTLDPLVAYATAGGVFQALILTWRRRRT